MFTACSSEDVNESTLEQITEADYIFKLSKTNQWEAVVSTNQGEKTNNPFSSSRNGNSLHAHGDFGAFGGQISFSGTQNNGGSHGSATLEATFDATYDRGFEPTSDAALEPTFDPCAVFLS